MNVSVEKVQPQIGPQLGRLAGWAKNQYPLFILVGLLIAGSFASNVFLTGGNLANLVSQMSVTGVVVLAELVVIISGGIDISVGSTLGLAAVLCAGVNGGSSVYLGLAVALAVGTGVGAVNGSLVAFRNIDPFIVTLGMLALARGLTYAYTKGAPLIPTDPSFPVVGSATVAGFPDMGFFWIGAILVVAFLLRRTIFGRRIYAIGSNRQAAYAAGVPIRATLLAVFALAGLLAGLAGFLLTSFVDAGTPTAGLNYELDAIAAAVIGGARLGGGYGSAFGAVVGTTIFGVITNLLILLNVSTFYQDAARGALILVAVLLASAGRGSTRFIR